MIRLLLTVSGRFKTWSVPVFTLLDIEQYLFVLLRLKFDSVNWLYSRSYMKEQAFKKMAGTSAVFLSVEYNGASPVERDGMIWSALELHLDQLSSDRVRKESMPNALALEGLEDYDMPHNGDVRRVESVAVDFVYIELSHAWIQLS